MRLSPNDEIISRNLSPHSLNLSYCVGDHRIMANSNIHTMCITVTCVTCVAHLILPAVTLHCIQLILSSQLSPLCEGIGHQSDAAEAGDIALLHPTYHCFTLPHWNRCYITPQHVCIFCPKRIRHQPTAATRDQHHTPPCVRWTVEQ